MMTYMYIYHDILFLVNVMLIFTTYGCVGGWMKYPIFVANQCKI